MMQFNRAQRVERDGAHSRNNERVDQFNLAFQKMRAVAKLQAAGFVIGAARFARVAKGAVGDKDLVAAEIDRSEQRFEVPARGIAVKWNARPVASIAARSLGDEHDPRIERAVEPAEHGLPVVHSFTGRTGGRFGNELIKGFFFIHNKMRLHPLRDDDKVEKIANQK